MPNIASLLKSEITRLARKEVRQACDGLRKQAAAQRTEIAGLRRRVQELEGQAKRLLKAHGRAVGARAAADVGEASSTVRAPRFSSEGLAAQRRRLGLSAADFALLVGTTGQSVYAWEAGKSVPRAKPLSAIADLRRLGKREIAARLAMLKA